MRLQFSHGNVTVLQKMVNYQATKLKLTNNQASELKSGTKIKLKQH